MNKTASRKFLKAMALVGSGLVATASLTACGGSGSGVPTINVYGSTSDAGFDQILNDCNKDAAGKYKIVPNLIPSDADSQREQFVRRLAAHDDGMDVLAPLLGQTLSNVMLGNSPADIATPPVRPNMACIIPLDVLGWKTTWSDRKPISAATASRTRAS